MAPRRENLNDSFDSSYTSVSQQSLCDPKRRSVQFKETPEIITEGFKQNNTISTSGGNKSLDIMQLKDQTLTDAITRQKTTFKKSAQKIYTNINNECNAVMEKAKVHKKAIPDRTKLNQAIREYLKASKITLQKMETTIDEFDTYEKLGKYMEKKAKIFDDVLKEMENL